jgi:hypothetical protein
VVFVNIPANEPLRFAAVNINLDLPAVFNEKERFIQGVDKPYLRFFHVLILLLNPNKGRLLGGLCRHE